MKHTNEFLRGMFSAYMGCDVINTDEGKNLKMIAISGYFISVYEPPYPFCESEGDEYEWMFSECKPILTPLSEITDEDAEVLGKYRYSDPKALNHIQIGKGIISDYLREDRVNGKFELEKFEIDYLRSPFRPDGTPKPVYDLGYMHIPSLIAADLAISSKQI